jgi:hypothetical protein
MINLGVKYSYVKVVDIINEVGENKIETLC